MKLVQLKSVAALLVAGIFAISAVTGVDSFEIYLNNKLLLRHTMLEPLAVKSLDLDGDNLHDELKIRYVQCNAPGKTGRNRRLSLVDEGGSVVREWKFDNGGTPNNEMIIPVRELLAAQRNHPGKLILTYTADDFGRSQQLASL